MIAHRDRILVAGLHGIALLLLALHVYVRLLPATPNPIPEQNSAETRWWGLWPATYVPQGVFLFAVGLCLAMIIYLWWRELTGQHPRWFAGPEPSMSAETPVERQVSPVLVLAACLLFTSFVVFPIVHTRWGDAYVLAKSISWPDPALRLTHSWQAPLDVFLHSRVWLLLHPYMNWTDAAPVYRWLSPLAGAIYLGALLLIAGDGRFAPGWLTFGLVASLGLIQLFYGYVENYSFAAAGVLVYLWLGIDALRSEKRLWAASTALAVTTALHPSTIVLVPSLIYLTWALYRRRRKLGNKTWIDLVLQVVAPVAAVAIATLIIMESGNHGVQTLLTTDRPGGGDASWFVPLRETHTRWERYTMFSWPHLRDFLNVQMLVAPVVLPSLLYLGTAHLLLRSGNVLGTEPETVRVWPSLRDTGWFLVAATTFYLLLVWAWNPDYGGQRDWDLFSLVTLPETLLLVFVMTRMVSMSYYLALGALPLIVIQALHTAAWIHQNTLVWEWP